MWISLGIGVYFYKKIGDNSLKLLILFQVLVSIADIFLIYILPKEKGAFVKIIYCTLKPLEYNLYVYMFKKNISINKLKYYYLLFTPIIMYCLAIYTLIFLLPMKSAATNVILIEGIFTIILVLLYFKEMLDSKEIIDLTKTPLFLIAIGLLIFFSGNIIATGFYHQLKLNSPELAKPLYKLMNHLLGIFQSIMFGFAYYVASKYTKK